MSGGGTNTVTQAGPPSWLQPYLTGALSSGQSLASGPGPQYYPGQQVAPLNSLQEGGLSSLASTASGPNASQSAEGGNQYLTSGSLLNGSGNAGLNAIQQAGSPSSLNSSVNANNFLTSGALLNPSSNPYLQGTFTQAANAVQNQLSSEFAGAGRNITGSLPVQSDEMNNLATQLYGGAYQQGVNQMGAAVGNTAGLTNAQYTPAQLTNTAFGTGLTGMNQASALAPSLDQGTYLPSQELLQGGAGLQGQTQNLINANMNEWNYNQQLPYNQLSWYSGLVGQNAAPFNSQSSTTNNSVNPWMTGLGAATAAAGLGTAAAEIAPLMLASDVRVKKHALRIGSTPGGIPVYNFRYVWDADDAPLRTGVMAHEVAPIHPDAVSAHPHGYLLVDYSKIR